MRVRCGVTHALPVYAALLQALADSFNAKKRQGLVQGHGSGYGGSGFKFDKDEDAKVKQARKSKAKVSTHTHRLWFDELSIGCWAAACILAKLRQLPGTWACHAVLCCVVCKMRRLGDRHA
jgi:hypothetical protein